MCFCKCQTSYSLSLFRSIVFLDPCPDVLLQMPDKLLYVYFQEYSLSWSASMETSCGQYLLECLSWYLGPRVLPWFRRALMMVLRLLLTFHHTFLAKRWDTVGFRLRPSMFFTELIYLFFLLMLHLVESWTQNCFKIALQPFPFLWALTMHNQRSSLSAFVFFAMLKKT